MRIVIQRVTSASVAVDGEIVGRCGRGMLVLIGVGQGDGDDQARWLAKKTAELRVFPDEEDKMNRSIVDVGGSALVVSQFTLLADCRKGRRPAFTGAAEPAEADRLYRLYAECLRDAGVPTETGIFAADMQVELINDGPVTLVIERL